MKKLSKEERDLKQWFIIVENQQLGPFSLQDLKREPRFTPDTLVWKKDFKEWIEARFVLELQKLFKDDPDPHSVYQPPQEKGQKGDFHDNQDVLTMQQDPYQFILWVVLLFLILFYTFYRFYAQQ